MHKNKILSIATFYILYILVGPQGPFSDNSHESHPHTHSKNSVKLLKKDEDLDQLLKPAKLKPLTN